MTTSMPAMPVGTTATIIPGQQGPPKGKKRLADLMLRRKLKQEDAAEKPVIPADAQSDGSSTGGPDGDKKKPTTKPGSGTPDKMLKTSMALVAPDTTPNAEEPLDPSQVPQGSAPQTVATSSSSVPLDNGQDALRTLIGQHQENFKPELISSLQEASAALERSMNGEVKSDSSATASAAAASVLSAAQSGKKTDPHYNPESMSRGIAVTRQILGM